MTLGPIAFLSPWLLAGLLALPVIWWLLRVTPPAPRRLRFPPLRLLLGLQPREETPAHTPLWLILLRLALAALVILGLAEPLLNPGEPQGQGPLVLVVDDGWASASGWDARRQAIADALGRAEREGAPVKKETLTSRLIDRPIRPLFPDGFKNEVQVICLVVSGDQENDPDVLAMNGTAAALWVSPLPFLGPIASVRRRSWIRTGRARSRWRSLHR